MNADLEEQLKEMGPEYRSVVDRLRAGREIDARDESRVVASRVFRVSFSLLAASLLAALAFSIWLDSTPSASSLRPSTPYGAREYRLTVDEMIATQRPDGGWQNDFLTRRNAGILSRCKGQAARVAYKKALRNLRSKGVAGDRRI